MTVPEETTQTVVHVELPKAIPLAGAMLEFGAIILLDSDPTSETGQFWLGEVMDFEVNGEWVTIHLDPDQVAVVEVMKAQLVVVQEADPKQAVARWAERLPKVEQSLPRHDG